MTFLEILLLKQSDKHILRKFFFFFSVYYSQPQLLVLADSSTLNAFTTDKISAASITADETELSNANTNTKAQAAEAEALLLSSAANKYGRK